MAFSISPVETEDVDSLARKVEFPAHQANLLYRLMFPRSKEQREDQIRWTIDGLPETVHQEDEALYKACGEDGSPVGLLGWTTSPGAFAKGMLREERQRVLRSCQGNAICRITFMAVDPNHQCQGVGSMLMQSFCGYVDENALDAFVLSSPAGIPLYSKFGFKAPLGKHGIRLGEESTKVAKFDNTVAPLAEINNKYGLSGNNNKKFMIAYVQCQEHPCFNELQILDRPPYHDVGLALRDLHG
ncbi:conserved hypothetical protein [Histoplasma capsulatum H143]|uniref:N-acetyltransferase domain-containing protein n=1 Tax=Ajellomyces capsulatus (strain H143) TaxID=544712 RepID=C6HNW4_AJECH|nr:conserved hypothetical protein [Histoplasma capsulatum H143]